MDDFFKGLVERAHYYEKFESFRTGQAGSCAEPVPKVEEKGIKEVLQTGKSS